MKHPADTFSVIAEPHKQELFIIREFDAPRQSVYKAFSDPAILVQFFVPGTHTMTIDHYDCRDNGSYRYSHSDNKGNVLCTFFGTIHEATSPERIIMTSEMKELPERGHTVMESYDFIELSPTRTKLIIQDVCRSVADRDAMIQSGMADGVRAIFDKLDICLNDLVK